MSTKGITGNEPDARLVYADIIDHPHWQSPTRKRMSMYKRAGQFSPFDALAGYSDMIAEEERVTDERMEQGEHDLEALNRKLNLIAEMVDKGEHPDVTFTVFVPDERKVGGKYVEIIDTVKRIDMVEKKVVLMSTQGYGRVNRTIEINCIISINGGMLYVNSSGDGLDSNGWLYFNGGYTIVDGPTSDNNSALDASIGMVANGGEVLAIGSSNMAKALNKNSLINNISIVFDAPQLANTKIQIKDSNGNVVLEHTSSKPFNHITASTSRFKQGQDYVIQINNEKQQDFTIHSIVNNVRISNNDNDKEELIMQ